MKPSAIHVATMFCVCAAASVRAHHSHPYFYDACKVVTVEGRIDSVQWKDPHVRIDLRMEDGSLYHGDWASLRALTRDGVATDTAKAALGFEERVVLTGNPIRDAAQIRARFPSIQNDPDPKTLDLTQIRRADGSWSWAQAPRTPPNCDGK